MKKVLLNYNKTGRSVGVATIIFHKNASAAEAVKLYDGVQVDGRPMKVWTAFDSMCMADELTAN